MWRTFEVIRDSYVRPLIGFNGEEYLDPGPPGVVAADQKPRCCDDRVQRKRNLQEHRECSDNGQRQIRPDDDRLDKDEEDRKRSERHDHEVLKNCQPKHRPPPPIRSDSTDEDFESIAQATDPRVGHRPGDFFRSISYDRLVGYSRTTGRASQTRIEPQQFLCCQAGLGLSYAV